jgi:hypothetical protein
MHTRQPDDRAPAYTLSCIVRAKTGEPLLAKDAEDGGKILQAMDMNSSQTRCPSRVRIYAYLATVVWDFTLSGEFAHLFLEISQPRLSRKN